MLFAVFTINGNETRGNPTEQLYLFLTWTLRRDMWQDLEAQNHALKNFIDDQALSNLMDSPYVIYILRHQPANCLRLAVQRR